MLCLCKLHCVLFFSFCVCGEEFTVFSETEAAISSTHPPVSAALCTNCVATVMLTSSGQVVTYLCLEPSHHSRLLLLSHACHPPVTASQFPLRPSQCFFIFTINGLNLHGVPSFLGSNSLLSFHMLLIHPTT